MILGKEFNKKRIEIGFFNIKKHIVFEIRDENPLLISKSIEFLK